MKISRAFYSTFIQQPVMMVSAFFSKLKNVTQEGFSALATLFNSLKTNIRSLFNRVNKQQNGNSSVVARVANRVLATSKSSSVPTFEVSLPGVSQQQLEKILAQLSNLSSRSPQLASPSASIVRLNVRLSDSTEPLIFVLDEALFKRIIQLPQAQMSVSTFFLEEEASQDDPKSTSSGIASALFDPTHKEQLDEGKKFLLSEAQLPLFLFLEGGDLDSKLAELSTSQNPSF